MNGLISLDETCTWYSQAPTDDLIRFWRSDVIELAKSEVRLLVLLISLLLIPALLEVTKHNETGMHRFFAVAQKLHISRFSQCCKDWLVLL